MYSSITIEKNFVKDLATENTILERIINNVMNNEEVPKKVKDEIIEYAGKEWFCICEKDEKIFWNGTEVKNMQLNLNRTKK